MSEMVKVKKKKFNFKKFIILFLFFYAVIYFVIVLFNEPIRHIKIKGNKLVSDIEIIEIANLKNYPSINKYLSSSIEKKIETLDLIESANVKKRWGFVLEINDQEKKPLFYDNKKYNWNYKVG